MLWIYPWISISTASLWKCPHHKTSNLRHSPISVFTFAVCQNRISFFLNISTCVRCSDTKLTSIIDTDTVYPHIVSVSEFRFRFRRRAPVKFFLFFAFFCKRAPPSGHRCTSLQRARHALQNGGQSWTATPSLRGSGSPNRKFTSGDHN